MRHRTYRDSNCLRIGMKDKKRSSNKNVRQNAAFTLVELMVVVLILGALAFVAIPRIGESTTAAKMRACETNIDMINRQAEKFHIDKGRWPNGWAGFQTKPNYFKVGDIPVCPFGTPYNWDSTKHRIIHHNH